MGQHSDPGGYPCHDNAVEILRHYQNHTYECRPHAQLAGDEAVQLFHMWRVHWMEECLRRMRPWDTASQTGRINKTVEHLHATSPLVSGF